MNRQKGVVGFCIALLTVLVAGCQGVYTQTSTSTTSTTTTSTTTTSTTTTSTTTTTVPTATTTSTTTTTVAPQTYTVTIKATTAGTAIVQPVKDRYLLNESVYATPLPKNGYNFIGWGEDLSGNEVPKYFTIKKDTIVKATYVYAPTVAATVTGSFSVGRAAGETYLYLTANVAIKNTGNMPIKITSVEIMTESPRGGSASVALIIGSSVDKTYYIQRGERYTATIVAQSYSGSGFLGHVSFDFITEDGKKYSTGTGYIKIP